MKVAEMQAVALDFLDDLPNTLEYTGEFGAELVLFLPFCAWLSEVGLLKNKRILTYRGMSCFYDDLDCLEVKEKADNRKWVSVVNRPVWLPVRDEHTFGNRRRSPFHLYGDARSKFRNDAILREVGLSGRKLVIIHNKYNDEWNAGPINFISEEGLDTIFSALKTDYQIVYIRHGMADTGEEFALDANKLLVFDDRGVVAKHPEVLCFDDLYQAQRGRGGCSDINRFKCALYSECYRFITTQGGGAHQISMFGGSLLCILHRRGSEEQWAYKDGYYNFLAANPPVRLVCRDEAELTASIQTLEGSEVVDGRLFISAVHLQQLRKLSPWNFNHRQMIGGM